MTRLIFVRHCEAEGNTKGVLQGRTDCDVSGNSAVQLELIALRLRNEPFATVYSSPLKRAFKTAQAINQYHDLPIQIDPRLSEIDVGAWEGRSWEEIEREDALMVKIWNESPEKFQAERGESMKEVYDRVWAAAVDIAGANRGKMVCIVSHGCAIRNFLCRALGRPLDRVGEIGWCDNTAVSVVDFDDSLQAKVVTMNDASHLPREYSVYRKNGEDLSGAEAIAP
ncbi:histidine phosphatase family protein [Caproiciproducens sp. NJN-50]|uniref:histidine phosphatase family protein n=1 Tax=Acutalibacteraceae TaxID=3082771 RepID=UPI000FFE1C75|nr:MULTISPECIES: histidine phosphatase family protein [Acutalibacteraceae]QAT50813.1 histidine phosphatase family protein [Caproiciproducens sp. NJN-50]